MNFDFEAAFNKHSERIISRHVPEMLTIQKRADEYTIDYMASYLSGKATSISLDVTKAVFEEYHQFLMKMISEYRKEM